jgi:hypothetical protein
MEHFTNTHHVFWERRSYVTPLEKRLRKHRGFVLPIDLYAHSQLHADMQAPPKPNSQQAKHVLAELGNFQLGRGGLYVVYHAIESFNTMARGDNELLAFHAQEIADHLEAQTGYINFREPQVRRSA